VTAPAVREIFKEIGLMRSAPLTNEELSIAKDSIARSLPGLFETTPQAASSIGMLFVHKLALDYYRTLPSSIEEVSSADVQRVAQKYLHPESAVVVVVGDRSKVQAGLEELELGPIEVRQLR
jgi:zinc protease